MVDSQKLSLRPLYLQVRDLLLERITNRIWKPGSPLPSELHLAEELGISPGTVRKALDTLEAERVITRRQGKGTFVNDSTAHAVAWRYDNIRDKDEQRIVGRIGSTELSTGPANEDERQHLCLPAGAQVIRIRRVHLNADRPYMYEEGSLPERLFPDLTEHAEIPRRVADLAQRFGLVLGRGTERVSVAIASEAVASKLSVAAGTPLLKLDRKVTTIDGSPVHWRIAFCHLKDESYLAEFN
jgi:GntR family transcriptional regulator